MRVEQMINNRGNGAMNQFVIYGDNGEITFQSYESMIVKVDKNNKKLFIGDDYNYSVTTSKHRKIFFEKYVPYALEDLADTKTLEKAIKNGCYNGYKIVRCAS